MKISLSRPIPLEVSTLKERLQQVRLLLLRELQNRKFVYIEPGHGKYLDAEYLFGQEVADLFPKAALDINAAGNCFAVEQHTATVFHLMRAAEHGLRYLAQRLRVRLVHSGRAQPVEYADWGAVTTAIKLKLTAINKNPHGKKRTEQLELYSDAGDHCTYMKDIWRNAASHTRKPYQPEDAEKALNRVKDFMGFLAGSFVNNGR